MIIAFCITAYSVHKCQFPDSDFGVFFNGPKGVRGDTVVVASMTNIIFGFIDNCGLFFGGSFLDEIFSKLPGGDDANCCAGYGNTFSDLLGSFIGTFIGMMVADIVGFSDGPLWAQAIGIFFGCLIGIAVPKAILRNSSTMGLNKVSHRQALLGDTDQEELEILIKGTSTYTDFKVNRIFFEMDENDSGTLTVEEIQT
jgi:uncharacterized membrane protein required for colicin V production